MRSLLSIAMALAATTAAGPIKGSPPRADLSPAPDLMSALRESDVVEICILRRDLEFVVAPRPDTVRSLGCKYVVRRVSREWDEFARAFENAAVQIRPALRIGEVRAGIVLGDRRGTILEIYSSDSAWPDGMARGYAQRRQVEISPTFVAVLQSFVDRHRELAQPAGTPIPSCPPATSP